MRFIRAYVEITNICGLACSFCPPKQKPTLTMSLEKFSHILDQLKPYTDEVALHVMGDPMVVSNLSEYLDIAKEKKMKVMITTTGYFLENMNSNILFHDAIKQINFSINSFNKNDLNKTFKEYIDPLIEFAKKKTQINTKSFINFRLWNIDNNSSEDNFNEEVLEYLGRVYNLDLEAPKEKDTLRLDNKVLIHFDTYFEWPNLHNKHFSHGYCHGLSKQIAFLSDGTVVPCCLDAEGVIDLGNIFESSLKNILNSPKTRAIVDGFKDQKAVEELCQKCSYKVRFNESP
jgi:radical SAM protein with 4Fe4S-binding SPASM domain